jgi:hypothetical protein
MLEMLRVSGEKGFIDTSWEDAQYADTLLGQAFLMDVGDGDNPRRPLVGMVRYAPGAEVPVHHHDTDYVSIVVEGEIEVTRKVHRRGSIRVVKKGTAYGPLKAGPEGCLVVEVFADRSGISATFLGDDELAETYRRLQAEALADLAAQAKAQAAAQA